MIDNNIDQSLEGTAHAPRPTPEIVVGLDDSPASRAALRWAAEHSKLTGVPLRVVHAWAMSALAAAAITSGAGEYGEAAASDARAHATRWVLDTLGGDAAGIRWTLDIVEGAPGAALVARSDGARLLVVGTREHTGLHRAVLGSVSHFCLSHAGPPVVAVPAPEEGAPAAGAATRAELAGVGPLL